MNYLLFVYYNVDVVDSEQMTNEIGMSISDKMTSREVKFMFGDKHAIFHFASNLTIDEMSGWVDIILDDLDCFEYFLVPKPRKYESNFDKDNLNHLLSLKKTVKKTPPKVIEFGKHAGKDFTEIAELIMSFKRPEVCNMTLDEILDKINLEGMDSLSELEKQKLDEYSKSI